jgi:glutathione S-transferase
MLTLFHAPGELSSRIVWLLEELQADYQLVRTHFPKPDGSGADPANPHPHGYAPTLVHDGRVITETGAIALYLTDLHPASPIGVPLTDPRRGDYLTWLFYQVGMTEPLVNMQAARLLQHFPPYARLNDAMWDHLHDVIGHQPWMLGDRFTAVDILYIELIERLRALFGPDEVLDRYVMRGADRPARLRAQARIEAMA